METNLRLALLIDGDNAQADLIPQVLAEVSKYGIMTIRRVYGDWSQPTMKGWKEALNTYALRPQQQFAYTKGKNATDIALVIDAMDFLHTAGIDGVCIVSSDSDYTGLATHIREKNLFVMGIGKQQTPRAFVNACTVFVYTENLTSEDDLMITEAASPLNSDPVLEEVTIDAADPVQLERLFTTAFESAVRENGWATLAEMGSLLRQLDPAFDSRTYGYKHLSQLVEASPDFIEVKRDGKDGGVIHIRLKGDTKPTK